MKNLIKVIFLWTPHFVHALPLDNTTRFFIYLIKNIIFKKDLESSLIFVLFLKEKQNKKENPKCDSLFGKIGV